MRTMLPRAASGVLICVRQHKRGLQELRASKICSWIILEKSCLAEKKHVVYGISMSRKLLEAVSLTANSATRTGQTNTFWRPSADSLLPAWAAVHCSRVHEIMLAER